MKPKFWFKEQPKPREESRPAPVVIGNTGDSYVPVQDGQYMCLRTRKRFTWEEAENRK